MENLPVEHAQGTRGPLGPKTDEISEESPIGRWEIIRQEVQGTWKFVRFFSKIMIVLWLWSCGYAKTTAYPAIRFPSAIFIASYFGFVLGRKDLVDVETGKVARDVFRSLFNFIMGYGLFGILFWLGNFSHEDIRFCLKNSNLKLTRTMKSPYESRPEPEEYGYIVGLFLIYYLSFALIFLMRGLQLGSKFVTMANDGKVKIWRFILIIPTSVTAGYIGLVLLQSIDHPFP